MVVASGVRIRWDDLPGSVRRAVEEILGGQVVEAVSQAGGFSPGTADRVRTADGTIGAGRDDLVGVLAGFGGFFSDAARHPAPPGLPSLRAFQRAQADVVVSWLRETQRLRCSMSPVGA